MKANGWEKKKPECHQVASRCVLSCWYLCFVFMKTFFKFKKPYQAEKADNRLVGDELFSFPDCIVSVSGVTCSHDHHSSASRGKPHPPDGRRAGEAGGG